jgi:predicted ArsR family transcriptional regulator
MSSAVVNSDADLLDLLRVTGPLDVSEMAGAIEVTATAVRQRLTRMMARGLIQREAVRAGRGRPRHRYQLTDRGLELTGSNFTDLAIALWHEIQSIEDAALRGELLKRVARALAKGYLNQITGNTPEERMLSLRDLLAERRVPFTVEAGGSGEHPTLTAHACPYPKLADQDRTICQMEQALFTELLGQAVEMKSCRLDGDCDCQFQAK